MTANKKDTAKSIIQSFISRMDAKKLQGLPMTSEEQHWLTQKNGLIKYVYEQKEIHVVESEARGSKAKLNNSADCPLEISYQTIYNAITEMMRDRIIEIKDGYFTLVQTNDDPHSSHPILKIASRLPITHLPLNDLVVFRVPERYAEEIAHYLNSQFFCNDIYTVAVSGLIICLDVKLPNNSKYETKRSTVETRVKTALKCFKLEKYTDKNIEPGYTPQQVEKHRLENQEARFLSQIHAKNQSPTFGGSIQNRPVRRIKCKPIDPKPH